MGTPELAAASLEALLASRHEVVGVVSQPDRPAGRGKRLVSPPVAALARAEGLPLTQPTSVKTAAFRRWLAALAPDLGVVAAFGHVLGPRALAVPRLGCVNVHASLLPRWRGASPIQMAIAAGDAETGVCIMQMDPGLDTGDVLLTRRLAIGADETADALHDRLAATGAAAIVEALDGLETSALTPTPQPGEGATYAPILGRADGELDWSRPADELARLVRAFHPWPGTRARLRGQVVKILPPARAVGLERAAVASPGAIVAVGPDGVDVACGVGAIRLGRLQLAGKRPVTAEAFASGQRLAAGMAFDSGASTGG